MISEICAVMQWIIIQIFILQSIVINCSAQLFSRFTSNRLGLKDCFGYRYILSRTNCCLELNSGKSLGIDGLQLEFYKLFCYRHLVIVLERTYVFCVCNKDGMLPLSF